jgi:general secretion pathway protein J
MNARRHTSRRRQAFTLLELLIAVGIFGIVLASINTVFYSALRLRNRSTAATEERLPIEHAVEIIKQDLAGLMPPGGTLSGQLKTSLDTSSTEMEDATAFYTNTGILDDTLPWGEVQKISYLLVTPTNQTAGRDLVRFVTRNLLPATTEEEPAQQWLMSGVESITFQFYDGSQWVDTWDTTTPSLTTGLTNVLPKAVKVQIERASEDRSAPAKPPIEIVVPVVAQGRTNQTSQASGGGQ